MPLTQIGGLFPPIRLLLSLIRGLSSKGDLSSLIRGVSPPMIDLSLPVRGLSPPVGGLLHFKSPSPGSLISNQLCHLQLGISLLVRAMSPLVGDLSPPIIVISSWRSLTSSLSCCPVGGLLPQLEVSHCQSEFYHLQLEISHLCWDHVKSCVIHTITR